MKSNCCNQGMTVVTGGEGTSHYRCNHCGNPCDPTPPTTTVELGVHKPGDVACEKCGAVFPDYAKHDCTPPTTTVEEILANGIQDLMYSIARNEPEATSRQKAKKFTQAITRHLQQIVEQTMPVGKKIEIEDITNPVELHAYNQGREDLREAILAQLKGGHQ